MKLLVTSDLHIEKERSVSCARLPAMIAEYMASNPTEQYIFAIVGDVSQDLSKMNDYFSQFSSISIPKLFVAGNHDIWIQSKSENPNKMENSLEIYQKILPKICKDNGFHYLDQNPYIFDRIGFVGNIGWYDFSFHSKKPPPVSKELTFIRRETNQEFTWSDINYSDLSSKELWAIDEQKIPTRISVWNDLYYIKWPYGKTDADFCKICYKTINKHFQETYSSIDHLVFMSHHALFEECIVRYSSYSEEFNNAYRGSKFLGDYVITHPKLRKIIFGHTHNEGAYTLKNGIRAINPYYSTKKPFHVIPLNF
jgi:predicted phosphodiesterase